MTCLPLVFARLYVVLICCFLYVSPLFFSAFQGVFNQLASLVAEVLLLSYSFIFALPTHL